MLLDILPYQLRTETFASAELTRQKKLWSPRWKGQKKVKYNFDYTDIHTHRLALKREQPAQILKKKRRRRASGFGLCSEKQGEAKAQEMPPQVPMAVCWLWLLLHAQRTGWGWDRRGVEAFSPTAVLHSLPFFTVPLPPWQIFPNSIFYLVIYAVSKNANLPIAKVSQHLWVPNIFCIST